LGNKPRLAFSSGKVTFKSAHGNAVMSSSKVDIPAPGWKVTPVRLVGGFPHFSLGMALRFGKDKTPVDVVPAPENAEPKVARALKVIEHVWPQGFRNLERFTTRIVPIKAKGVVSFSYRNRPQLSFINCYDRNQLDMVDDLIHENAHHHL